jgi:hypothetical protein
LVEIAAPGRYAAVAVLLPPLRMTVLSHKYFDSAPLSCHFDFLENASFDIESVGI